MYRTSKTIMMLLILIVIMLTLSVGVAIYYVLELDWFKQDKRPVKIYKEQINNVVTEQSRPEIYSYDMTKRQYDITNELEDMNITVYKDGTVGVTIKATEQNKQVNVYKEILEKEIKVDAVNIVKAFKVQASKSKMPNTYILLLDKDGNIYKLNNKEFITTAKFVFTKIEGVAKIRDIVQITGKNVVDNKEGFNVIAIDNENNEILITDYLVKE